MLDYNRWLSVQPFGFEVTNSPRPRPREGTEVATVDPKTMPSVIKNVCPLDCPDTCSMLVTVRDGVAVELRGDPEHFFTRGFLCQKMARFLDRVYSPDRLMFPMKRVGRK